ncbi:microviridin/marinostatin family tricyclic proteinase inhibitor [Pseudoduganella sp. UC29_71]
MMYGNPCFPVITTMKFPSDRRSQ